MGYVKKIWEFLMSRINITITPSPRYNIKSFTIPKLLPLMILIIFLVVFFYLCFSYLYYRASYIEVNRQLESLREDNEKINNEGIIRRDFNLLSREKEIEYVNFPDDDIIYYGDFKRGLWELSEISLLNNFNYRFPNNSLLSFIQKLQVIGGLPTSRMQFLGFLNQIQTGLNYFNKTLQEKKDINNLRRENNNYIDKDKAEPSIWPVKDDGEGYISSGFGYRDHPISGERTFHNGIDIGVWFDTPVIATADGEVSFAGWRAGYGFLVKIEHGFGYSTRYAHLNEFKVEEGQKVEKGEIIALSGSTGQSTGPHLHYEVRLNNEPQNPKEYIGGN